MRSFNQYTDETYFDDAAKQSLDELTKIPVTDKSEIIDNPAMPLTEAVSIPLILGVILSAPTAVKLLAKGFGFIVRKVRGLITGVKERKDPRTIRKVVLFANKWHHSYIKAIRFLLFHTGVFNKVKGLDNKISQERAAEVVFYAIIFWLLLSAGLATVESIIALVKNGGLQNLSLGTAEGILSAVKTKEMADFLRKVISL